MSAADSRRWRRESTGALASKRWRSTRDRVVAEWIVAEGSTPAAEPDEVALIRMSIASTWAFEGVDAPG